MIERHVTFHVLPEKTHEFEKLFINEYRPAMATVPGFIKAELLREQSESPRYQMVLRFESSETAAAWRSSSLHQSLQPKIKPLYLNSELLVYEVIA